MGGLRKFMPVTFATYAIGMMALSGVPLLFSGFWSKDEILHFAHGWPASRVPFYLGAIGALLTAFYMTRQVFYVFFGNWRLALERATASEKRTVEHAGLPVEEHPKTELPAEPHESPGVMLVPLLVLAAGSILLGFLGTPAWPWFQSFLEGQPVAPDFARLLEKGVLQIMLFSSVVAFTGIGLGWWLYGRKPVAAIQEREVLERLWPNLYTLLRRKYYIDEVYDWALGGFVSWWARVCDWFDRTIWNGGVQLVAAVVVALAWLDRFFDEKVVNLGFDELCHRLRGSGQFLVRLQNGHVQTYLRVLGLALAVLVVILIWGCRGL
jgi:NADH-quinone oxidoreductase subunit L